MRSIKTSLVGILLCTTSAVFAQQHTPTPASQPDIMITAVSRLDSMFSGGIGVSKLLRVGKVTVEPLAWLTPDGKWKKHPCNHDDVGSACVKFGHTYLNKPHTYTVVSTDGKGAVIHAAPVKLDSNECYGYTGTGTYTDKTIAGSAIAASSTDIFSESSPLQPLDNQASLPIRKAFKLASKKLDSIQKLRVFSMRLEGQDLYVVQRSYEDFYSPKSDQQYSYIFAIGSMDQGNFHLLHAKENTEDESEQVLGTIHLKNGREFLVTTISEPESQYFRVYGIQNGKLTLVFTGGGSSC